MYVVPCSLLSIRRSVESCELVIHLVYSILVLGVDFPEGRQRADDLPDAPLDDITDFRRHATTPTGRQNAQPLAWLAVPDPTPAAEGKCCLASAIAVLTRQFHTAANYISRSHERYARVCGAWSTTWSLSYRAEGRISRARQEVPSRSEPNTRSCSRISKAERGELSAARTALWRTLTFPRSIGAGIRAAD